SVTGLGGDAPTSIGRATIIVAAAPKLANPLERATWPAPGHLPGRFPGKIPWSTCGWLSFVLPVPDERSASMIIVSVAQACGRLGIDAKTLRRWLAEAQLPLHRHPHDGRKKGVSAENLHLLARRHQRRLAPLPPESSVPIAGEEEAVPAALLAL